MKMRKNDLEMKTFWVLRMRKRYKNTQKCNEFFCHFWDFKPANFSG